VKATEQLAADGFAMLRGVYAEQECHRFREELTAVLAACADEAWALRRGNGIVYGARNLLELFPRAEKLWRKPAITELLQEVLGANGGLVRGLFFDKPPLASWSLPWHRDLTIAVQVHGSIGGDFRNPTTKAGVPHVEAPDEVLRQMLTLRIHLDSATADNGPLEVIPGSHASRDANPNRDAVPILAAGGDVLAMRPLILHASGESTPSAARHRRVIHLEFAADTQLPEGYRWYRFVPIAR
jgi:ectoine hydroxylase-related dioxygenase (phytanoyl-CoA dioxygenase family)